MTQPKLLLVIVVVLYYFIILILTRNNDIFVVRLGLCLVGGVKKRNDRKW